MKALFSAEAVLLVLIAALHFVVFYDGYTSTEEWANYLGTRSIVEGRDLDLGDDYQQSGLSEAITAFKGLDEGEKVEMPGVIFTPTYEEGPGEEGPDAAPVKEIFDVSATLPLDPNSLPSAKAAKPGEPIVKEAEKVEDEAKKDKSRKGKAKKPVKAEKKDADAVLASEEKVGRGTHVAPGTFFLDAPFYMLGKKFSTWGQFSIKTGNPLFDKVSREDGTESVKINTVILGHVIYSILAILVFYAAFILLGYAKCHSIAAAALMLFGTPLALYGVSGYSQAGSSLALAVLFYFVARLTILDTTDDTSNHLGSIVLVGFLTGIAATMNYVNAFALVGLLVYIILMRSTWAETLLRVALLLAGFALVAWTIPFWFKITYGQWTHPHMGQMFNILGTIKKIPLRKVFLLENNGLFVFAPIVVVGLFGAVYMGGARDDHKAAWFTMLFSLITFGLIALATDCYVDWMGGQFSSRLMTGASLLLGLGVVHLLGQSYNRVASYIISFLAGAYSLVLLFIYHVGLFPAYIRKQPFQSIGQYKLVFTKEHAWLRGNLSEQLFQSVHIIRGLIRSQRLDILFGVWTIFLILVFIIVRRLERRTMAQELMNSRLKLIDQPGSSFKRRGV